MANIKSAIKRIRVSKRNHRYNLFYKNKIKKLIKEAKSAIREKKENASQLIRNAVKWIDKAASKDVIKKNNASRKKSRLMRMHAASSAR